MLELKRTARNKCITTVDNLKISKIRQPLALYFQDLGIPKTAARNVVTQVFASKECGPRLYRITTTHYVFVDYDTGLVVIGTDDQLFARLRAVNYFWAQICLWLEMADHAARGRKMSRLQIREFIAETEIQEGLMTKNIAPLSRSRA